MSRRQSRGGPGLVFIAFSLIGGFFIYLTAYCVAGWWGVLGTMAFVGLVSLVVRSEIAASAARQRRADDEWVHYHSTYSNAPQRRSRSRQGR